MLARMPLLRAFTATLSTLVLAATAVLAAQSGVPEAPTKLTASATGSTVVIAWHRGPR